jgi:transcriptional regulator with XRE-family HTH domain
MTTMRFNAALEPSAKRLREAVAAKGFRAPDLARAIDVSHNTVSNRMTAKSGVTAEAAQVMAKVLDCAWEPLVSKAFRKKANGRAKVAPKPKPKSKRKVGRPKGGKNKPRAANGAAGPAGKALALHKAAALLDPPLLPFTPRPVLSRPVLAMEVLSDGTASIVLNTVLPIDRASAVFRQLLDMSLVR